MKNLLAIAVVMIVANLSGVHAEGVITGTITLEPESSEAVFGYDGPIAPEVWGDLDPRWTTCGTGQSQSPIDIDVRKSRRRQLSEIHLDYKPTALNILNNGHTVEVTYDPGSSLQFRDTIYELEQFHFHSPSEHAFNGGAHFPVELHAVHKSAEGKFAVAAVMISEGDVNPAAGLAHTLPHFIPKDAGVTYFLGTEINLADYIPDDKSYYFYRGSFTTPPCTEGVLWIVLKTPVEWSKDQISTLNKALNNLRYASETGTNNRPTQALNDRRVFLDKD